MLGLRQAYARWVQRLRRTTVSTAFIPEIDALRFLAIGSVVAFHVVEHARSIANDDWARAGIGAAIASLARQGRYGVELFFVISGFVLALPFAAHALRGAAPIKLRDYYLRRLTRLEPPYLISLLGLSIALLVSGAAWSREVCPHLVASAIYQHNLIYGAKSTINGVAWSLEIEVQFYVLMPLLAQAFRIRRAGLRRSILAAAMMAMPFVQQWLPLASRESGSLVHFLQFFLAGLLLADLHTTEGGMPQRGSLRWDAVFLATLPLLLLTLRLWTITDLFFPWLLLLLCGSFFRSRFSRAVLNLSAPVTIGGMCYSMYLLHWPVMAAIGAACRSLRQPPGGVVQCLLMLPAILVATVAFFLLIEKPCMDRRWPRRLWTKLVPARMPAADPTPD